MCPIRNPPSVNMRQSTLLYGGCTNLTLCGNLGFYVRKAPLVMDTP